MMFIGCEVSAVLLILYQSQFYGRAKYWRECSTEIIGLRKVLEAHVAFGFASCYMTVSNFPSLNNFRRL